MSKICSNCGKENLNTGKFCENCGTILNDIKTQSAAGNNKKNKSRGIRGWWNKKSSESKAIMGIGGLCCIGLILIVGIWGLLSPDATTTTSSVDTANTSSESTSPYSSDQTYNKQGISFNYPSNWEIYTPDIVKEDEILDLRSSSGNTSVFAIFKNSSFDSIDDLHSICSSVMSDPATITSDEETTVDGVKAFKIKSTYSNLVYSDEQELICFFKNGMAYILLFTTGDLDKIQSDIDTIVNSFKTN